MMHTTQLKNNRHSHCHVPNKRLPDSKEHSSLIMRYQYFLIGLVLLVATACTSEANHNNKERQIAELKAENKRLNENLTQINSFVSQFEEANGNIFKQQVISRPAKFTDTSDTLQAVRDRKRLICGVNADLPGFGFLEPDTGEFVGFDIDICRAIGAAVLGQEGADLVEFIPLSSKQRFTALQTGGIDVLTRNTTWTLSRDTELRADYAGITFYDGQGVMVHKDGGILKVSDLQNQSICVQEGSTSQANIKDYFVNIGLAVEIFPFEDRIAALKQYESKACAAYTADKSSLIAQRTLLNQPKEHRFLVDEISREPLGPVVRHHDNKWKDVVFWTTQCLLNAEAIGISQRNVDKKLNSEDSGIKRLLGTDKNLGEKLSLPNDFCYQVIRQVGSYKDIYDRHLGVNSKFQLARGLNALNTDGGIQYAVPFK